MLAVTDLGARLAEAEARYAESNPESRRLHEQRALVMPGGNTRTTIHQPPFPLTIVRGEGARITDADGHEYVDFLGEYTAGLYGHSHPVIMEAIRTALADGIVLGAPNRYETALAEAVCERFPSIDLVRFCNSGTEANLLALSLARAVTERSGVLVFAGAYHGGILLFAHGVSPLNPPFTWIVGEYNDSAARRAPDRRARARGRRSHRRAAAGRSRGHPGRSPVPRRAARGDGGARRAARLRRGDDVAALEGWDAAGAGDRRRT